MHKFVDVSNNNGSVDFAALKAAGAVGVYLKVSEGIGFADPTYKSRYAAAKAAGLKVGGYHFGHPKNDPLMELKFFLSLLKLEKGDLKPALDLEVTDEKVAGEVHTFGAQFLHGLRTEIKETGVLYAGAPFMKENLLDPLPSRKWIPSYGAEPAFFSWDAWQFTDGQAKYPGALGGFDTSYTPSIVLLTYKAHPIKKVIGHGKKHARRIPKWPSKGWFIFEEYGRKAYERWLKRKSKKS